MTRIMALAALLITGTAAANEPIALTTASIGDGVLLVSHTVQTTVMRQVTHRVERNGQTVNVTQMVPTTVEQAVQTLYKLADVQVHDLDGLRVDPDKLPELFEKPRAVILSPSGKIDKALRNVFKPNTLIIKLPKTPPPASIPRAPGK